MRSMFMLFAISVSILFAAIFSGTPVSADMTHDQLNGTWSGSWIPAAGRDAMTIEIKHDDKGKLTGRFVTPKSIAFTKATFDSKTHSLLLEGADAASGKPYRITAKVQGNEMKGTATAGNESGPIDLIKWTFVPR